MDTEQASQAEQSHRRWSYALLALGVVLLVVAYFVGITDNPPGIASMLLGVFALILGVVYRVAKWGRRNPAQQLLYWAPRALCIAFALFISLFALDVFGEGQGFWATVLALLIHLIPTFLVLLILAISWRREWIAGVLFIVLAALYVSWAWNKPFGVLSTFLLMSGPLVVTGLLFLLNWYYRTELRGTT
jgi:hypothetical protein